MKRPALGNSAVLWSEHVFERLTFKPYPWFYPLSYLWLWMSHLFTLQEPRSLH